MSLLRLFALASAVASLAWTPLEAEDGTALGWPADAWPLPLADDASIGWLLAAMSWTRHHTVGFVPVTAPARQAEDGVVALVRVDDEAAWDELIGDASLVAFTLTHHDGGNLTDADVLLNTARFEIADSNAADDRYGLQAVALHELGHVLGLGHSEREDAVMAPALEPGAPPAAIGADDEAGLLAVVHGPPARRPELLDVTSVGDGSWRLRFVDLERGDLVRLRAAGVLVDFEVQKEPPDVTVRSPAQPPLDLEIWTTTGQGRYEDEILLAPMDAGTKPDDGDRQNGGCAVMGDGDGIAGAALALFLLIFFIARRRRACGGGRSR